MTRTHAVLIGGGFNGVLSALPIIGMANCLCCLWVVGGGVITAWLLQQVQADPLELGEGALGGLLAGVVGAGVYTIVWVPLQLFLGSLGGPGAAFEMGDVDVPPEMLQMLEAMEQIMSNPPLLALMAFFMMLAAGMVFSTVGGLLGAFFFRKAAPPAAPGGTDIAPAGGTDIVPPPPPV